MSSISAPTVKSKKRRKGGNLSSTSNLHGNSLEEVGEAGIIIVETNEDLAHFQSAETNQVPHLLLCQSSFHLVEIFPSRLLIVPACHRHVCCPDLHFFFKFLILISCSG